MIATFLGTGTSTGVPVLTCRCGVCTSDDPRDRRLRPSLWLQWPGASVLVDAATDLRQQALREGIDRVDAVLFTHAHADHILGMDELRLYNWRQRGPIPIYGLPSTLQAIRRTFWYVFEDVPVGGGKPLLDPVEVEGPFALAGRRVVPVPALHGCMPVLGYRLGALAYLTDISRLPEDSEPLLEGLEVLVINALRPRPHPTHLSLEEAIELARRVRARCTYFTHMGHEMPHARISDTLPEGIRLAYDGLRLELPDPPFAEDTRKGP